MKTAEQIITEIRGNAVAKEIDEKLFTKLTNEYTAEELSIAFKRLGSLYAKMHEESQMEK